VVADKFKVVLARFLQTKYEDEELLEPVRRLDEIVGFEFRKHVPVRII